MSFKAGVDRSWGALGHPGDWGLDAGAKYLSVQCGTCFWQLE